MLQQTPDPNWFPSSLAQSAAGVVGVLSAVLATQLQHWLSVRKMSGSPENCPLKRLPSFSFKTSLSVPSHQLNVPEWNARLAGNMRERRALEALTVEKPRRCRDEFAPLFQERKRTRHVSQLTK
jgi:hypothetical protein